MAVPKLLIDTGRSRTVAQWSYLRHQGSSDISSPLQRCPVGSLPPPLASPNSIAQRSMDQTPAHLNATGAAVRKTTLVITANAIVETLQPATATALHCKQKTFPSLLEPATVARKSCRPSR